MIEAIAIAIAVLGAVLLLILFAWIVWGRVLDGSDRGVVIKMVKLKRGHGSAR